jgi:hypothetical protein
MINKFFLAVKSVGGGNLVVRTGFSEMLVMGVPELLIGLL